MIFTDRAHVKVQFGAMGCRAGRVPKIYLSAGEDIQPTRERYAWFLEDLFGDAVPEKGKGQRGKPLAELIYSRGPGAGGGVNFNLFSAR